VLVKILHEFVFWWDEAAVFGDPHFYTFDNMTYTFNGRGEFVLLRTDSVRHKLDVQGRFEAINNNVYGTARATLLTSIAGYYLGCSSGSFFLEGFFFFDSWQPNSLAILSLGFFLMWILGESTGYFLYIYENYFFKNCRNYFELFYFES